MRFAREAAHVAVHFTSALVQTRGTTIPQEDASAASEGPFEGTEIDHIITGGIRHETSMVRLLPQKTVPGIFLAGGEASMNSTTKEEGGSPPEGVGTIQGLLISGRQIRKAVHLLR